MATSTPSTLSHQEIDQYRAALFWLGWNHVGDADKVFGILDAKDGAIAFWGARTGELTFKPLASYVSGPRNKVDLRTAKKGRRYEDVEEPTSLRPDFFEWVADGLVTARLFGTFHQRGKGVGSNAA